MSNWSGKTLGRVQIGELIARGGMAEVYVGEHTSLNRKVAVKIMRDHVDSDPETQSRFEREARVVASLRHPNIIQMFDYQLVEGQPCLIMELVPGATLGSYLKALHQREEKLPFDMVSRILSALASAIDYAHEQNIVHRDIKPANVLLRSATGPVDVNKPLPDDVEPILTDFGLVRLLDSSIQTSTGTVSGTPAYMSPEQARGDKVDRKTDIYSLGVVLYEMLAGTIPFDAESSFGMLMKHINDRPPAIESISSDLQTVMDRALAKDPQIRYSSAKELADEFIGVFNGQTVSINTADFAKIAQQNSEPKQERPFPWVWAGIGALVIFGLAFASFRFFLSPTQPENQSVGRVSLLDFNALMDRATVTVSGLSTPEPGTHYEVWYLAEGGEIRRNIGKVSMDDAAQGQLVFNNSDQENILSLYDQLEVTIESDNDVSPDVSSGDVVASSVFPPLALIHVRHVLVSFQSAPNEIALIQGLWNTADSIDTNTLELRDAFNNGDEELVRLKTEQIINQLVGNTNEQHRDWNENGTIDDPGDGFGLFENGNQGYILNTISHAQFAAESADATENIQVHSAHVVACIENMKTWSEQLLEKTLQLQEMPFGSDMDPLINEMVFLSNQVLFGSDVNGNELIEPTAGEGGGDTAYEHSYYMAEMPLLLGEHQIPSPAK
ncbi:MAG: protein kinase [Anaerolineales bacterium]|nr:protein kinase [Anaerolineales bacterium]